VSLSRHCPLVLFFEQKFSNSVRTVRTPSIFFLCHLFCELRKKKNGILSLFFFPPRVFCLVKKNKKKRRHSALHPCWSHLPLVHIPTCTYLHLRCNTHSVRTFAASVLITRVLQCLAHFAPESISLSPFRGGQCFEFFFIRHRIFFFRNTRAKAPMWAPASVFPPCV
jgi:hypothetical protein